MRGDDKLEALRTLAHAWKYLEETTAYGYTQQFSSFYWGRRLGQMMLTMTFNELAKTVCVYDFAIVPTTIQRMQ